ncbi:MAG: PilZ domain-containing protein [Planctomycetota bacterium]
MKNDKQKPALMENRGFPRVSANCEMTFRPVEDADGRFDDLKTKHAAALNNISGGGISFEAPAAVAEGQMLALELQLPGFPMEVISMGKVSWCDAQEKGGYEIGVEFWWIGWKDEEAQNSIRNFIADRLRCDD